MLILLILILLVLLFGGGGFYIGYGLPGLIVAILLFLILLRILGLV